MQCFNGRGDEVMVNAHRTSGEFVRVADVSQQRLTNRLARFGAKARLSFSREIWCMMRVFDAAED